MSTLRRGKWVAPGFAALTATTLGLIVLGASVRARGAGLACPDWPLCFGKLIPQFNVLVAFEWSHRALASFVSLGLVALSWACLRNSGLRERMRGRLVFAWLLLLTQAVFGGLTVLLKLAPWTVSVHLILGNVFCLTLFLFYAELRESDLPRPIERLPIASGIRMLAALLVCCLFLQLLLGGLVSSQYAGLACPSFPTCDGESMVPTLSGTVGLQVLHRLNGLLLLAASVAMAWLSRQANAMAGLSWIAASLVSLQIAIGVANVLLRLPFELRGLHTGLAAMIVLTVGLLVREIILSPREEEAISGRRLIEAR
ncbi:MAG: heme A synthase [bacterium]|nr:heme A synthase [bacterium]